MPLVMNLLAIPNEETPGPVQATEELPITKGKNTIDRKMDNMMKAFEAWSFQWSKANEPTYGGYQTGREYTIQADDPPMQIPMNFPPPNAPMGPTYYRPAPNYQ